MKNVLKNLRYILLPLTIVNFLLFIEDATDAYGVTSDEEGRMYLAWILLIINVALFIFNKKWQQLLSKRP